MFGESSRCARAWHLAALSAAALALTACGGGGGGGGGSSAADQSISGVVIDGPLQGATVCLDLNKNNVCDAGEPTSSATDAQGRYTITGLTADQVNIGVLLAVIPADAIDAGTGSAVGTTYKITSPAGKGAVISPITHLVQTGIAQGMTLAAAEAAVAGQLQVGASSLYNNYTSSSTGDNAALAIVVPRLVASLQAGETPILGGGTGQASYFVRSFNYTDPSNYKLRYYLSPNTPDASGLYTFFDERVGLTGGLPTPASALYDLTTSYASPQGWKTFDGSTPNTATGGSPNRSTQFYGYTYVSTHTETDVSGQTLVSVVAQVQDLSVNTESTLTGVLPSQFTGTFPAGSKIRKHTVIATGTAVAYRASDGTVTNGSGTNLTSLAALVAAYPLPSTTPTTANTASMGNLHSTCSGICSQERLRVAFGAGNATTYYLCDYNASTGTTSNCGVAGTGTYSLGTAVDGVTPIMTFAGLPTSTSVQTYTRVFVQRGSLLYFGTQSKVPPVSDTSVQTRLNKTAFEAIATALGITPPSMFTGTWSASYSGSDTGSCTGIAVDTSGNLSGSCTSTGVGGSFTITGTINSAGAASFIASGGTSSGATFSGNFGVTTGSGTWTWPGHSSSGTWTATKP